MPFHWREIYQSGGPSAPGVSLAGRNDGPAESRGDGVAAVVQRGSEALNQHSISWRINREIERMNPIFEQMFENHARGGALVYVVVEHNYVGEMEAGEFRFAHYMWGIFAEPQHAMSRWPSFHRANPDTFPRNFHQPGRLEYRFFWVTRT